MDLRPFLDQVIPAIVVLLGGVVSYAIGVIAAAIKRRTNIDVEKGLRDIEARYRETYQTALTNAAAVLIGKIGIDGQFDVQSELAAQVIQRVIRGAGDAVRNFSITEKQILADIVARKDLIAATSPSVTAGSSVVPPVPRTPDAGSGVPSF